MTSQLLLLTFLAIVVVKQSHGEIYSNNNVIQLKQVITQFPHSFFGYAVHIQKDNPSRIIIGAPKYGANAVGAVFDCTINLQTDSTTEDCNKYMFNYHDPDHDIIQGNNLFGATIDGGVNKNDIVFIGMPKLIRTRLQDRNHSYYAKGATFQLSDVKENKSIPRPSLLNMDDVKHSEYYYGFAEIGFSMDVFNESDILIGVPGLRNWRGNALYSYTKQFNDEVPIARSFPRQERRRGKREMELKTEELIADRQILGNSSLAGYAVTRGAFFGHTSFAIGIPNGHDLFGAVWIYGPQGQLKLEARVTQDSRDYRQFGSHFGSALCAADINGDGFDDLLIGAPNYPASNSFDDGRVYVYLSDTKSNLYLNQIIEGQTYSAHRFGIAMSNLGKITLDQHESVAIASPYVGELGVVYVFVWSDNKLVLDSKIEANGESPGAFGFSLSRAVDINNDNIADFAAGDYQRNSVSIIKSSSLFHYDTSLEYPAIYTTHEPEPFQVKLCIFVHQYGSPVLTHYEIKLDHRLKFVAAGGQFKESVAITRSQCKVFQLDFLPKAPRLSPLDIFIALQEQRCDHCPVASPTYPKVYYKKIPFNYNCKETICNPKLHLELTTNSKSLVIGKANVPMRLRIENQGDPAFVCNVEVTSKPSIDIYPTSSNCKMTSCEFNYIDTVTWIDYELKLKHDHIHNDLGGELNINILLTCVNVTATLEEHLQLQNVHTVDVHGSEISHHYDSTNVSTHEFQNEIVFFLRNDGPSPMHKDTFRIRIPRSINDEQIIEIYQPNEEGYTITPIDGSFDLRRDQTRITENTSISAAGLQIQDHLPKDITCDVYNVDCLTMDVTVDFIAKDDSETIAVPLQIDATTILKHFSPTFAIYGTMRSMKTDQLFSAQINVIDMDTTGKALNIWLIVGGVIAGLLLFAGIIYALRKLNFFNRPKHDKLLEEQQELELNAAVAKDVIMEEGPAEET